MWGSFSWGKEDDYFQKKTVNMVFVIYLPKDKDTSKFKTPYNLFV